MPNTRRNRRRRLATPALLLFALGPLAGGVAVAQADADAPEPALFETHIHYNADVWDAIPPADAIGRLDRAGFAYAFVSSTPTEGTERLHALAPERIVPLLRPYREYADRRDWFADPELVARLEGHLAGFPYRGIGEFHVFGADASTPVMQDLYALASERGLFLHAHADTDAIVRILAHAPGLPVVWAHAGFDVPTDTLGALLATHTNLLIELSYRSDIAPGGDLAEAWRRLFTAYPDRFLVGMDTHAGGRWVELDSLAAEARAWLAQLPADVAEKIGFGNAARLAGTAIDAAPPGPGI
jgi:hypothetical protein